MVFANPLVSDLKRIVAAALLSLFLLPAATYLFVNHAMSQQDAEILAALEQSIDQSRRLDAAGKREAMQLFRSVPPSKVCDNEAPALAEYRNGVCAKYSMLWQFQLAKQVSVYALVGGVLVLLAIVGLGVAAFRDRRVQYLSFVAGWRLMTLTSAAETVVQGALAVWLSFWLTAFFFQVYFIKLIALAGIGAAIAVFAAVVCIFKRVPNDTGVEGELVSEAADPALWAHVRELAARAETAPPDQIVAGIDTNFFVTEAPLLVGAQLLTGRTLFVSLPLLRLLDRKEADAVLAHELAHFRGGDTASSAELGPKLVQYDQYAGSMREAGVTFIAFYLLRLYRVIFELALKRDSRAREFLADGLAASLVSPQAITNALIKVGAYAQYRGQVEQQLFAQDEQYAGELGIAGRITEGLAPYAASAQFIDAMQAVDVPHPFDSHPPLCERMRNVGDEVREQDYSRIVTKAPEATWISDIPSADAIEQRLWARYEGRFAAEHEHKLAYSYLPATEAERAVVLKYFPPLEFALRGRQRIAVTYEGLLLPKEAQVLSWDNVTNLKYDDGFGGDVLEIVHPEKGWIGAKKTKVRLPGIRKERARFKAELGRYWERHQVMRKYLSAENPE